MADGVLERLQKSADRIAALSDELDAERARRAGLIAEAHDAGHPWYRIARHARLSTSSCHEIWAST